MSIERNFHCKNCDVIGKFIAVKRVRYAELNGARGGYGVDLWGCVDCDYTIEGLDQKYLNDENKMIAEQGLIIDANIFSGGDL